MGNCCSADTVGTDGDIQTLTGHNTKITPQQLVMIIKVQARIRGLLARRRVKTIKMNAGMGGYQYDGEVVQDYDNQKVQEIRNELGEFDY